MFKKLFSRIKDFVVSAWEKTKKFVTDFVDSCRDRVDDAKEAARYTVETLKSEGGLGILLSTIKDKIVMFFKAAWAEFKRLLVDIRDNWEAAVILILATIGLSYLIGQIPLTVNVPEWMEASMIIPVIASAIISLLTWLMLRKAGEPCSAK